MFMSSVYLEFDREESLITSNNSKTALLQPQIVRLKLQQELLQNRIAGPFSSPPFSNFNSPPLSLNQKHEKIKYRLLHNLSYPHTFQSVNNNIPNSASTVQHETRSDAVAAIQQCSDGAFMAKSVIADAFRLISLHPSQYHFTVFSWVGNYYYDKCLPQGSSSSCQQFEQFSSAFKWILINNLVVNKVVKVLDDLFFVADTERGCALARTSFRKLCKKLGITIADHTTIGLVQVITFLGIELDSNSMIARLPPEKLDTYREEVLCHVTNEKITIREM